MRIAAVTMAYNEPDLVPIWLRHYAAQLGAAHCTIVDHGSDDGSTEGLGPVNVIRIPRSPQDDAARAAFLSELCGSLLHWYDWVIYSDIDELLVADPRHHASLAALCEAAPAPVVTAVGLNVQHLAHTEPPIDLARPISLQRPWAVLVSAMCKPLLISRKVRWAPGFHCCDAPIVFAPLFLFHLRHYDLGWGLRRLAKTRAMPWRDAAAGQHQRLSDAHWRDGLFWFEARFPRRTDVSLELAEAPLHGFLDAIVAGQHERAAEVYKLDLETVNHEMWRIPQCFAGTY